MNSALSPPNVTLAMSAAVKIVLFHVTAQLSSQHVERTGIKPAIERRRRFEEPPLGLVGLALSCVLFLAAQRAYLRFFLAAPAVVLVEQTVRAGMVYQVHPCLRVVGSQQPSAFGYGLTGARLDDDGSSIQGFPQEGVRDTTVEKHVVPRFPCEFLFQANQTDLASHEVASSLPI